MLLGNSASNAYGSHPPRLCDGNHPILLQPRRVNVLRYLRRFSASRFPNYYQCLVMSYQLQQFIPMLENRQHAPLVLNRNFRLDRYQRHVLLFVAVHFHFFRRRRTIFVVEQYGGGFGFNLELRYRRFTVRYVIFGVHFHNIWIAAKQ